MTAMYLTIGRQPQRFQYQLCGGPQNPRMKQWETEAVHESASCGSQHRGRS